MPSSLPSAKSPPPKIAEIPIDPDPPDPPPNKSSSSPSPGFLWSNLFAESASSNVPSSSLSFLADGTPVVTAPPSVLLRASSHWAGHLLCRFLGEPPSPAKFFSDLNRVWGKHGDIAVRRFSSGVFLVHVPSASTRKWILQTGLWSSGTVSFVVSEWSVNATLASPPKLTSATTLLTIKEIPPQLWSHEGVATIAGGVAKLIPGTRASLPLSSLGTATIRAIVPLGSPLPPSVMVKDTQGDSVLVSMEYGRLPHLCSICNSYGHQQHRCLLRKSATKPISPKLNTKHLENVVSDTRPDLSSIPKSQKLVMDTEQDTSSHDMELDSTYAPRQPSIQVLETISQTMELDSTVDDDLVLKRTSDHPLVSASSSLTTDVLRTQPKVLGKESCSSPFIVSDQEGSSHSIDAGMEIECPSSIVHAIEQIQPSSSDPSSLLKSHIGTDLQNIPSMDTHLEKVTDFTSPLDEMIKTYPDQVPPIISSSDGLMISVPIDPTVSSEPELVSVSPTHLEQIDHKILPSDDQTKFDFPPSKSCALNPDTGHCSATQTFPGSTQSQLQLVTHSSGKKESIKAKRKAKTELRCKELWRCTQIKHQFKPQGVVEKRRKKVSHDQVLTADDLQQSLLEDTLYFGALEAHKILQKISSDTHGKVKT